VCHQPWLAARAHAAIVAAVEHGALTAERVFEASARVAALKAKFPRRAGLDAIRARMGWV
jgi:hypothetical protein